ncbi:MAG: cyclic pyranopterin monophosphate synthase MoaC [Halobacteriota archaeon]|nr:cyclic pyranopterin monophosphate synthase MoaC [Halobacteriota archaeon]
MANASGIIKLCKSTIEHIQEGRINKGNVLESARVAAILAMKRTSEVIPMNHMKRISGMTIDFEVTDDTINVAVEVNSSEDDLLEMEALYGVSVALLTIWDMVQSVESSEGGNYPHMSIYRTGVTEDSEEPLQFIPSTEDSEVEVPIEDIENKVDRESLREILQMEGLSHLIVEEDTELQSSIDTLIEGIGDGVSIEDIDSKVNRDSFKQMLQMEGLSHPIVEGEEERSTDLEKIFKGDIEEIAQRIHIRVCKLYVSVSDEVNVILIYSAGILFRMTDEEIYSEIYEMLFDKLEKLNMIIPLNIIVKKA